MTTSLADVGSSKFKWALLWWSERTAVGEGSRPSAEGDVSRSSALCSIMDTSPPFEWEPSRNAFRTLIENKNLQRRCGWISIPEDTARFLRQRSRPKSQHQHGPDFYCSVGTSTSPRCSSRQHEWPRVGRCVLRAGRSCEDH
jgi:hypothetical protein